MTILTLVDVVTKILFVIMIYFTWDASKKVSTIQTILLNSIIQGT